MLNEVLNHAKSTIPCLNQGVRRPDLLASIPKCALSLSLTRSLSISISISITIPGRLAFMLKVRELRHVISPGQNPLSVDPTCKVRVSRSRFYQSWPAYPPRSASASTASCRSQWALPDLNRELQNSVGTAGSQLRGKMSYIECQNRCQIECQNICQIECQSGRIYQNMSEYNLCQIECQYAKYNARKHVRIICQGGDHSK